MTSDLHNFLDAAIYNLGFHCEGSEPLVAMHSALKAVVERHKPRPCTRPCSLRHEHVICRECGSDCPTIQDIARELGVSE